MCRREKPRIPRSVTSIPAPTADLRSRRPRAAGYVPAPGSVRSSMWARWPAEVEAHAMRVGLSMPHLYSDSYHRAGTPWMSLSRTAARDRGNAASAVPGGAI